MIICNNIYLADLHFCLNAWNIHTATFRSAVIKSVFNTIEDIKFVTLHDGQWNELTTALKKNLLLYAIARDLVYIGMN